MKIIIRIIKKVIRIFKLYLEKKNLLQNGIILEKNVVFNSNTVFEKNLKIWQNTNISNSYIGMGSYIAENTKLNNSRIGRFCSIAQNVKVVRGNHPVDTFVSTNPVFFSTLKDQTGFTFTNKQKFEDFKYADKKKSYSIIIGNDVWIGANVSIMEGVTIGNGAIIGTNSLITKDIEPYTINVGIPSKKIRKRFEDKFINFLNNYKWWNKDFEWIEKNYEIFENIEHFYNKFSNESKKR